MSGADDLPYARGGVVMLREEVEEDDDDASDDQQPILDATEAETGRDVTAAALTEEISPSKLDPDDGLCVICFEREPDLTLEPCGHANLCHICLSRLAKRRCPTCRARARKVRLSIDGNLVTRPVKEIIAERKQRELKVLEGTLQIVFLGPPAVGKKTLVRKLIARYPLLENEHPTYPSAVAQREQHSAPLEQVCETTNAHPVARIHACENATETTETAAATAADTAAEPSESVRVSSEGNADDTDTDLDSTSAPGPAQPDVLDVFSDGTDFTANACITGTRVRLTVLRRTSLASRRMMLDDVRVLKPDLLVLCCSAHTPSTFDDLLAWDKILRGNFQKPRIWALLTLADGDVSSSSPSFDFHHDVPATINSIVPPELRPRSHYLCSPGEGFSIGFNSLAKDIVYKARNTRDEELAASIAAAEARTLADQQAAGTLNDTSAATLVIANNGIPLSSFSQRGIITGRNPSTSTSQSRFGLRAFRNRDSTGGLSISGVFNWFSGSHDPQ